MDFPAFIMDFPAFMSDKGSSKNQRNCARLFVPFHIDSNLIGNETAGFSGTEMISMMQTGIFDW